LAEAWDNAAIADRNSLSANYESDSSFLCERGESLSINSV